MTASCRKSSRKASWGSFALVALDHNLMKVEIKDLSKKMTFQRMMPKKEARVSQDNSLTFLTRSFTEMRRVVSQRKQIS